jgi:uncharacterized protein YkwD
VARTARAAASSNGEAPRVAAVPVSAVVRASVLFAAVAASVAAGTSIASGSDAPACAGADASPTAQTVTQARAAIACLLNAARDDGAPLRVDVRLGHAAQSFARALDPAKPLTHAGHGATTPLDRIASAGYPRGASFSAAETLGRSHGSVATPARRVKAWLASASTRRLLTSTRYRDVGVGVVTRGEVTTFVVEVAVRRAEAHLTTTSR